MHTAPQAHTPRQQEAPQAQHGSYNSGDPRIGWIAAVDSLSATAPVLLQRRDGILPAVAAALSIRGETLTCTGSKGERPPSHHPLVQDFLDTLTTERRSRQTGRCPEAVLLSRYLTATEAARADKRNGRRTGRGGRGTVGKASRTAKAPKPLTLSEAKRALKHAKLTARRIREDGDPLHGSYAPPCRSCVALLAHFGVRAVDPAQESAQ
ncbi:YwqJ-related putative deaminase [Streptomyces sp. CA-250714]|uniref:YwqJ-related putative deaminase n=1 Tax=Streptomyces sp. CA-250714 TaxID=3240060 RepID=UPI003D8E5AB1